MTNTEVRPLPVDLPTLRDFYWPIEPDDTLVARLREAIARVEKLVSKCRDRLSERDEGARSLISELIEKAIIGREALEPTALRLIPGDVPSLQFQLEQLGRARSALDHKLTVAVRTDEKYLQWRRSCEDMTTEWRRALAADDGDDNDQAKFRRLVDFATTH